LEVTAYGVLGLLPEQFWNLTMREFRLMQKGYLKKLEDEQIHNWDLLRTMAVFVLQPHMKKGKSLKPKDIIPLPKDKKSGKVKSLKERQETALFARKKRELAKQKKSQEGLSSNSTLFDKVRK
jgi:hypothetical protein